MSVIGGEGEGCEVVEDGGLIVYSGGVRFAAVAGGGSLNFGFSRPIGNAVLIFGFGWGNLTNVFTAGTSSSESIRIGETPVSS